MVLLPFLGAPAFVLAIVLAFVLRTLAHRRSPRPRPLNFSPFTHLPPEIIQHIASFLRPSAAASFASTCLCIRLATGTQYLKALRASRAETFDLLELLLADVPDDPATNLPSRLLCTHCQRLIPLYKGCGFSANPACRETWDISRSRQYIESSFSPPVFHTAMAMHRLGRPSGALLAHITPPTTTTYHSENGVISQCSARYRIANTGSLLLRRRLICILPYLLDGRTYPLNYIFCRHNSGLSKSLSDWVALVQTQVCSGVRRSQSEFMCCTTCNTTILIGARKFRGRGLGLFATWWKDLGDGRADEKWARIRQPPDGPVQPWEREMVRDNYGNIVNSFEGGNMDYLDFDGLLSPSDRKQLLALSPYTMGVGK